MCLSHAQTYEGQRHPTTKQRHGLGKATLPLNDGSGLADMYTGEYVEGQRSGRGTYLWANGARYVGEYKANLRHGEGIMDYPDGSKYTGQWINGQREGRGVYVYVNGDTYEGEWRQDQRWGHGKYTYQETKSCFAGQWVRSKRDGHGEWVHPCGYTYIGIWEADKPIGVGKHVFAHGAIAHGEYSLVQAEPAGQDESASELPAEPGVQWNTKKFDVVPPPPEDNSVTAAEVAKANRDAEILVREQAMKAPEK